MKPKIKVVFVDLDGTLLQGVDTVSPRTVRAFAAARERGVTPVIATGRLAYEADFASRAIGADGYFIAMNGLAVYEDYRAGRLLYEAHTPDEAVPYIIRCLSRHNVFFQAYAGNRAYCQKSHAHLLEDCGMDEEHRQFFGSTQMVVDDLEAYLREKDLRVNKFFVSVGDPARIPALRAVLDEISGVKTLSSGPHYIEVVPEGADKKRAVHAVREALGLSSEENMVIGDSENDLGMFDEAFTCVAMGNAVDALKAKANNIAPTNVEDGVAWAVETLLLGQEGGRFTGRTETLRADEIEASLVHSTRQYLAGDLKLPQQLGFLFDEAIEVGISSYQYYKWEQPHYHTITSEYCYILAGETKYIDLAEGTEYHFKQGDFYILRRDTPYLQKCKPGCRLIFAKAPGVNDKAPVAMDDRMQAWCADWDAPWDAAPAAGSQEEKK